MYGWGGAFHVHPTTANLRRDRTEDLVQDVGNGLEDGEDVEATPALLNVELAGLLPEVVGEGEEDGAVTARVGDASQGGELLDGTRDRKAVGITGVGPAGLQVDGVSLEARADAVQEGELALDEVTGILRGDLGVEEGVHVATNTVDDTAEGRAVLLPDVQGLSSRDHARVAALLEGRLARGDESGKRAGVNPAVEQGLVADDDQVDEVPLGPGGDGGDLVLRRGDAARRDVDADDESQAGRAGGSANVLEAVAVGRVDADGGEAAGLDLRDVLLDAALVLALAVRGVRRVGDTVALATVDLAVRVGRGGGGAGRDGRRARGRGRRRGGGSSGSGDGGRAGRGRASSRRDRRGGRGRGRGVRRDRDGGGGHTRGVREAGGSRAAGQAGAEGADVGVVGLGDGHGLLGLGVGAGGDGGRRGDDQDGARRHVGGDGGDGVGAGRRADVGGLADDAGHGRARGLDGRVRAGDGGAGHDDGGDTADGVGAGGHGGGRRGGDGGLLADGDGLGRDGVGARGREGGDGGGRQLGRGRGHGGHRVVRGRDRGGRGERGDGARAGDAAVARRDRTARGASGRGDSAARGRGGHSSTRGDRVGARGHGSAGGGGGRDHCAVSISSTCLPAREGTYRSGCRSR